MGTYAAKMARDTQGNRLLEALVAPSAGNNLLFFVWEVLFMLVCVL
jgi:hypothetical protein